MVHITECVYAFEKKYILQFEDIVSINVNKIKLEGAWLAQLKEHVTLVLVSWVQAPQEV